MTDDAATIAFAEALHRIGGMECGPNADDYDDEAEHLIDSRDLLGNLRAHGWDLVRRDARSPLDAFATALGNLDRPK